MTRSVGVRSERIRTWGAVALDFDRDGRLDLLVNRHLRRPRMYEFVEGRFVARASGAFRPPAGRNYYDRHGCAWGQGVGDERLDLYCASGAQKGHGTGPNQLLVQTSSGLQDRAPRYGLVDLRGRGRAVTWLDFDGDRDLDLFLANEVRPGHPNRLWRNKRRAYKDVRGATRINVASTSAAWSDWDRDGDPDLLVGVHGRRGAQAYENRGRRFVRTSIAGVTGLGWNSTSFGDFNGDGWTDLQVVSASRSRILANRRGRFVVVDDRALVKGRMSEWLDVDNDGDLDSFVVQGRNGGSNAADFLLIRRGNRFSPAFGPVPNLRSGDGDALTVTDFDRDGRVDVVVTNGDGKLAGPLQILKNTSDAKRSIGVRLFGGKLNPLGYGARITISYGGHRRRHEVTAGTNYKSQRDVEHLVFGINNAASARVRVLWPHGAIDCTTVRAGEVALIHKGEPSC